MCCCGSATRASSCNARLATGSEFDADHPLCLVLISAASGWAKPSVDAHEIIIKLIQEKWLGLYNVSSPIQWRRHSGSHPLPCWLPPGVTKSRPKSDAMQLLVLLSSARIVNFNQQSQPPRPARWVASGLGFALFLADGPSPAAEQRSQLDHLRNLFSSDAELQLAFLLVHALPRIASTWYASRLSGITALHQLEHGGGTGGSSTTMRHPRPNDLEASALDMSLHGREWNEDVRLSTASSFLSPSPPAQNRGKGERVSPRPKVPATTAAAVPAGAKASPSMASARGNSKAPALPLVEAGARGAHEALMAEVAAAAERDRARALELSELSVAVRPSTGRLQPT